MEETIKPETEPGEAGRPLAATPDSPTEEIDPAEKAARVGRASLAPPQRPTAMPRVPGYRIIRILAVGGMGTVFEAEQLTPHRPVALKVIRAEQSTPGLLRRFEHEGHILGLLHHPGIAQIFEAGTFNSPEGRQPFFAMELINGLPLAQYADLHMLDIPGRLRLLIKVCEAVHHAHLKGVVHRDLKPDNILVQPDGQPKILDFGVARVTHGDFSGTTVQTHAGVILGTLSYMSPEQVDGNTDEVDARSDIYSLGVLGYLLLAGVLPINLNDSSIADAARRIREEEPRPLSGFNRAYRGDIDTIIRKALDKEKERRYSSAAEMAADIGRHLDDEPIVARPASRLYQWGKFARRNKALVAALAAAFLLLIIGIVSTSWQATLAGRQRELARAKAETSERVADFLVEIFARSNPRAARGKTLSALEILDEGARRVEGDLRLDPEIQGRLARTIGRGYVAMGEYEEAIQMHQIALRSLQNLKRPDDAEVIAQLNDLGDALSRTGRHEEGVRMHRQALDQCREAFGLSTAQTDAAAAALNDALLLQGVKTGNHERVIEAEAGYRAELVKIARRESEDSKPYARALRSLARALYWRHNRGEEVERYFLRSLKILRRGGTEDEAEVAETLLFLADHYAGVRNFELAENYYREALAIRRGAPWDAEPLLLAISRLAAMQNDYGRNLADAEALYREYIQRDREFHRSERMELAHIQGQFSWMLGRQGRFAEAAELAAQSLATRRRLLPPDSPHVTQTLGRYVSLLLFTRETARAEEVVRDFLNWRREAVGEDNTAYGDTLAILAYVLRSKGDRVGAERLSAQAEAIRSAAGPSAPPPEPTPSIFLPGGG